MSSRDEAVKIGAIGLENASPDYPEVHARQVLDAAYEAGLIVWADELEEFDPFAGTTHPAHIRYYRTREAS